MQMEKFLGTLDQTIGINEKQSTLTCQYLLF